MSLALIVGSIATMVVGAAMQAKAASDAASRQRRASEEAMRRQAEYQRQAEERAMEQAREYQTEDRQEKQEELEGELTQMFYQPVESAQTVNNIKSTTAGAVSSDYMNAKAKSNSNQQKMAQELAGLFGKQRSANRLRQNEAISMSNAATDIGRIGNYAAGQYGVDKMKIDEAGQPNVGLNILGGLATSIGSAGVSAGLGGLGKAGNATSKAGTIAKVP